MFERIAYLLRGYPELPPELIAAVKKLQDGVKKAATIKNKLVLIWDYPIANHNGVGALRNLPLEEAAGVLFVGGWSLAYTPVAGPEALWCNYFQTWNRFQSGESCFPLGQAFAPLLSKKKREELRRPAAIRMLEEYARKEPAAYERLKRDGKIFTEQTAQTLPEFFLTPLRKGYFDRFFEKFDATGEHRDCCGYADGVVIIAPENSAVRTQLMAQYILGGDISVEVHTYAEIQSIYNLGTPKWYEFLPLGPRWVLKGEVRRLNKWGFVDEKDKARKEREDLRAFMKKRRPRNMAKYRKLRAKFKPDFRIRIPEDIAAELKNVNEIIAELEMPKKQLCAYRAQKHLAWCKKEAQDLVNSLNGQRAGGR